MLEDPKLWFAIISVLLTLYAYIPYLTGILRGETKPHLFTWIVWLIMTFITVFIQVVEGGGMGAWSTIAGAIVCFSVTVLSIKYGSKDIKKVDYVFLIAALAAIPLWLITDSPTYAALFVVGIEIMAFSPTVRKSWHAPNTEVMSTYGLNTLRYVLSIFALSQISIATIAYPFVKVLMNGLIFSIILAHRQTKN